MNKKSATLIKYLCLCSTLLFLGACGGNSNSSISTSSSSSASGSQNIAPIAKDDLILVAQNQSVAFDYLTMNDLDNDGDELTLISVTAPDHGMLTKLSNSSYRYIPDTNFVGEDTFSYTVSDGRGGESDAEVTIAVNTAIDDISIRNTLLAGVNAFSYSPTRGHMTAFGPTVVNLGNYHDMHSPMAAAATMGAGRVVTMPGLHWASLDNQDHSQKADIEQFFLNSLAWLGRTSNKDIRIVHNTHVKISSWLNTNGYNNVTTTNDYVDQLSSSDVLIVWLGDKPSNSLVESVTKYIQAGGSALLVEFGDGFKSFTNWWEQTLPANGGNRVLRKAGIVFGHRWNRTSAPLILAEPERLSEQDLVNVLKSPEGFTAEDKNRIGENLSYAFVGLPESDILLARLQKQFEKLITTVSPTPNTPVTNAFEKSLLQREVQLIDQTPVEEITAHRTAEGVFGTVPESAERLTNQQVFINGDWSGYVATGLYAPPGELVHITVPAQLLNKGFFIRLSGHRDNIGSHNDSWKRMPSGIQRSFPLNNETTAVASPYGGAIYVDLLDGADGMLKHDYGEVEIIIDGAIRAPFFVLGEHSNQDWVNEIRQYPAPYAEFVTERVAVSVPSSMIRDLDAPQALLEYWDEFVAFQDWVGGTEGYRTGPDRINYDVQISVGYLHAGYPIQGPAHVAASVNFLDLPALLKHGNWGYFHELGHEMQNQKHLWSGGFTGNGFTFSGDTEVTCNIFANAALEKMAPHTPKNSWGYSVYHNEVISRSLQTINDGSKPNFEDKDPYPFYFALADGFGWEKYREILGKYAEESQIGSDLFPDSNQKKKDQWLIRWSKTTGFNLVEYMVNRWKLEVTQDAINTVHDLGLPNWLPATTTVEHFKVAINGERTLDFRNSGITLDGTATFIRVLEGVNHTITENGDGTHTFRAKSGFKGKDQFKVVYRSEVGNEVETVIYVGVG